MLRVTHRGIIDIPTDGATIFIHCPLLSDGKLGSRKDDPGQVGVNIDEKWL
jgi:hypothetical protein